MRTAGPCSSGILYEQRHGRNCRASVHAVYHYQKYRRITRHCLDRGPFWTTRSKSTGGTAKDLSVCQRASAVHRIRLGLRAIASFICDGTALSLGRLHGYAAVESPHASTLRDARNRYQYLVATDRSARFALKRPDGSRARSSVRVCSAQYFYHAYAAFYREW